MQNHCHRICTPVGDESETVIQTERWRGILLPVLLLLWFTGSTSAATNAVPSYAKIKAAADATYKARSDLLKSATGVVDISFRREPITREHFEGLQGETDRELCVDPEPFRARGHAETTTTWHTKGNQKRYDIVSPKPTDARAILIESNRRTVTGPARSICYDVLHQEAYMDRPSPVYGNPFGQTKSFDVHQLYRFNGQTVPELLYRWFEKETKSEDTREITREKLGQRECVKVYCQSAHTDPSGEPKEAMKLELWLAPEMAYSLVKARIWSSHPKVKYYFLLESCEASYEQSQTHPGIWVLKTLDYVDNQAANDGSEVLKATFRDTRIGVEILEEMFTFDGLGVPPGMVVYDKSRGGKYPPPRYPGMTPVFRRYYYMGRGRLVEMDG
jgi:hypothetical protein